jgi:hypothetical protein
MTPTKSKKLGAGFCCVDELLKTKEVAKPVKIEYVEFKTSAEFYELERLDITPGTVREFNPHKFDKRKVLLDRFMRGELKHLCVRIINNESKQNFERMVRGVKVYKGFYSIYWFGVGE